jgi:hypothetical protein
MVEIAVVALATILLEINYTRIFSYKLYYYFTYFIIGMALLGLGSGAVFVSLSQRLLNTDDNRVIATCCALASGSVLIGYWGIAVMKVRGAEFQLAELLKLAVLTFLLFVPFFLSGIVISTILSAGADRFNRLYAADLAGAALGCAISVPLMTLISPPGAVMLGGAAFAIAGWRATADRGVSSVLWAGVVAVYLGGALIPGALPDVEPDPNKSMSNWGAKSRSGLFLETPLGVGAATWYSKWSPVFRVDVTRSPTNEDSFLLHHDGQLGAGMYRYNGDPSTLSRFREDDRALPFSVLGKAPKVLIIGSAGGHEILASLYFGASEITGVELNPVTVKLVTEIFADPLGNLNDLDHVTIVNDEGRSFLARDDGKYDLIWLVAPDSYAAMNAATAGAYVLSESYLYTVEMIREVMEHLTPDGVLCAQFGEFDLDKNPMRTLRYLATAREAVGGHGRSDFGPHVLVGSGSPGIIPLATVLLGKQAFSEAQTRAFLDAVGRLETGVLRHPVADGSPPDSISNVATLTGAALDRWFEAYPYDVTGVWDDSPFFWHFTRFGAVVDSLTSWGRVINWEIEAGERIVLSLVIIATSFATLALLLPFFFLRRIWSQIPYKAPATLYFAALGIGFMLLEVSLIQMLTLFLGYPTYSLSVTLFSILVFTGIGSLVSSRYLARRNRSLLWLTAALVGLVSFVQLVLPLLVEPLMGRVLALRILAAVVLIAPLGVCLGAFMPIGMHTISLLTEHDREYVAWAWAVNGFFSVVSAILATVLAMAFGFKVVLACALAVYLVGIAALFRIPAPSRA